MGRGAVAALKEKGLNGKVLVTGSDGSNIGLEMVKNGDMLATVWNDPVLQGAVSMSIAYAAAIGDIDPEKLGLGKHHAAIDDDDIVAVPKRHDVHPELPQSAERDDLQMFI